MRKKIYVQVQQTLEILKNETNKNSVDVTKLDATFNNLKVGFYFLFRA